MGVHKVKSLLMICLLLIFWAWTRYGLGTVIDPSAVNTLEDDNTAVVLDTTVPVYTGAPGDTVVKLDGNPTAPGHTAVILDGNNVAHSYNTNKDMIIFIGGHPRSGTTLVRAMLDAHKDIRCGEETRVIPRILMTREEWVSSENEMHRLRQGGVNDNVLDAAVASFILEVIAQHGEAAPTLCNKDPLLLKSGVYLGRIFPRSKFLMMMRDGRAVVHSVMNRKITITGYSHTDARQSLRKWNNAVKVMDKQCKGLGPSRCLVVHYEQLVLHPASTMGSLLEFLGLDWDPAVLQHHTLINQPGGVRVSNAERSSDQIVAPVHLDALSKWVGKFPQDLLDTMDKVAPMLKKFGYDPTMNPPNYGQPDSMVLNNTMNLKKNKVYWEERAKQLIKEMEKVEYDYEDS